MGRTRIGRKQGEEIQGHLKEWTAPSRCRGGRLPCRKDLLLTMTFFI
ncbi:hypothetical protein SD77_3275 [Bacillus badius]|uniref:Ribose 5-phosphate isomerase B n=1 Tax=Bacillus badius TaxID=1455 RepID=A0ABR5AXE5_BACBA|nr:hypothetical protein SD77_3275 [Bacillus badius]